MTLKEEVCQLIEETEGYEDALNYVDEIAEDLGISVKEVIKELQRQLGLDYLVE